MLFTSVATATFLSGLQDGFILWNARDYLSVFEVSQFYLSRAKTGDKFLNVRKVQFKSSGIVLEKK